MPATIDAPSPNGLAASEHDPAERTGSSKDQRGSVPIDPVRKSVPPQRHDG